MRKVVFAFSLLCAGIAATPAKAEPSYRWCAQVGSDSKPACYFATFDKCRSYVMTAGGVCFSRVLVDEPEMTASRTTNAMSARTTR
jgi:hypothetical protein